MMQTQRTAAKNLLYRVSALRLKTAIALKTKTFNNPLGFERGLWKHQSKAFAGVPKRSVFGTNLAKGYQN
jgi:hypothetical protein